MKGVRLSRPDLDRIERHAVEAYPDEACGFLLGPLSESPGAGRTVLGVERASNEFEGERRRRFEIRPEELRLVEFRLGETGRGVVGFYHSHPDHPARPSAFDEDHAWPWYAYLVTAVTAGRAGETGAFELDAERRAFDEIELDVATPAAGGTVTARL